MRSTQLTVETRAMLPGENCEVVRMWIDQVEVGIVGITLEHLLSLLDNLGWSVEREMPCPNTDNTLFSYLCLSQEVKAPIPRSLEDLSNA